MPRTKLVEEEIILSGIPASPGIAIGRVCIQSASDYAPHYYEISEDVVPLELRRLRHGVEKTIEQLRAFKERVSKVAGDRDASIFDAHILFLKDKELLNKVEDRVKNHFQNVDYAFYAVVQNYLEILRAVDDTYIRSRTSDIEDIMQRALVNMAGHSVNKEAIVDENLHIQVAHDLTPSDTASMDDAHTCGFVTQVGSTISHTAILARSMGIPAVVAVNDLILKSRSTQEAIVDGYKGLIILNPKRSTLKAYRSLQKEKQADYARLEAMKDLPTETTDGKHIRLAVNVEFPHEFEGVKDSGADGIGLFRTEFFLLGEDRRTICGEEEQARSYTELTKAMAPHEVVFRTLDSGGDKLPAEEGSEPEPNPFLGWRGIRVSLSRPEMFKDQLRAILRASAYGKAAVMFPMISGRTEVIRAKAILEECKQELRRDNIPFDEKLKLGIMVEVPSAAILADVLADEVDFFSIGTNDLTQYTIAVDRVNNKVASMFRATHPGVIRMMNNTICAGKAKNVPTTICGEMASDIILIPLLIGLGADELSVGVHMVPIIRYAIRHLSYEECRKLADQALVAPDSNSILRLTLELARKAYPDLFA